MKCHSLIFLTAEQEKNSKGMTENAAGVAEGALEAELPAGLKLEDPGVLLTAGTKEGQIKVIREEGVGMAYSWDSAS